MRRKGLVPSRAVCVWTRKHLVSKLSVCKAFWAALATQPSGFHSLFESHEKKCFVREREKKKKTSGEVCREIFIFYCEQPNEICDTWASSENMTSPKKSTRLFWLFFSHLFSVTTWMQHQKAMEISLQHLPLAMNYPFVLGVDIHTYTYRFRCGLDLCRNNAQSIERKRRAHRNLPCRQLPHSVQKLAGVNV